MKKIEIRYRYAGMIGYYAVRELLKQQISLDDILERHIVNLNEKRFIIKDRWNKMSDADQNRYVGFRISDQRTGDFPIYDFKRDQEYAVWCSYTKAAGERLKNDLRNSFPDFQWEFIFSEEEGRLHGDRKGKERKNIAE